MPLLLLVPLLALCLALFIALMLPLSLLQRYRMGRKRRRLWPWANRLNTVFAWISVALFLPGAWASSLWLDGALAMAWAGLAAGMLLGLLNIALSRIEHAPDGVHLTPSAAIVLTLVLLVVLRIVLGGWQLLEHGFDWQARTRDVAWFLRPSSLFAFAGLLIGHGLAWYLALGARLRRAAARG